MAWKVAAAAFEAVPGEGMGRDMRAVLAGSHCQARHAYPQLFQYPGEKKVWEQALAFVRRRRMSCGGHVHNKCNRR